MSSKCERLWINLILRFGIGFLFLFAAINIFTYGVAKFAEDLAKGFEPTWLAKITLANYTGLQFIKLFLQGAPFVMGALAIPILTGILARPALRIGALVFLFFGLGKYIQNDIPTSAADFLFAFITCAGLYVTAREPTQCGNAKEGER